MLLNTMIRPTATVPNDRLSRVAFTIRSEQVVDLTELVAGVTGFSVHLNNILTLENT